MGKIPTKGPVFRIRFILNVWWCKNVNVYLNNIENWFSVFYMTISGSTCCFGSENETLWVGPNSFIFNKMISMAVLPGFIIKFNNQTSMKKTIYEV